MFIENIDKREYSLSAGSHISHLMVVSIHMQILWILVRSKVHGSRELIEQGTDEHGRKFYKIYYNEES